MKLIVGAVLITALFACNDKQSERPAPTPKPVPVDTITVGYLALGDSYTAGTNIVTADSYPSQLLQTLKFQGINVSRATVVARAGWTTTRLIAGIKEQNVSGTYDFVTLLIGVNNQYRGIPLDTYQKEFKQLLVTAIDFAGGKKDRVFVLSIPDWSVTPFGGNRAQIALDIDRYNSVNQAESLSAGVTYINITDLSRTFTGPEYLAPDDLHPSGKMYSLWVNKLAPEMVKAIRK